MKKPEITKLEMLKDTKFLKLYNAEYKNKLGNLKSWTIASRKEKDVLEAQIFKSKEEKIDAVVLVALHVELNKLVIIRQFRVPLNDYIYELPAGLIDSGEEFLSTVKRELKEETGLDLLEIDFKETVSKLYVSPGMTDESVALVYCTCKGNVSKVHLEEDEDIEVLLVSKEDAIDLINSNQKMDIKTLLALRNFIKE